VIVMESILLIVLLIAFWQWRMLQGPAPSSRWIINVDEGCLVLNPLMSRIASEWTSLPITIWTTDDEFVFFEGVQKRAMQVVDAWPIACFRRDAIQELVILVSDEARAACERFYSEGRGDKLVSDRDEETTILLLKIANDDLGHRVISLVFDQHMQDPDFTEELIRFFRDRAIVPFRVTI